MSSEYRMYELPADPKATRAINDSTFIRTMVGLSLVGLFVIAFLWALVGCWDEMRYAVSGRRTTAKITKATPHIVYDKGDTGSSQVHYAFTDESTGETCVGSIIAADAETYRPGESIEVEYYGDGDLHNRAVGERNWAELILFGIGNAVLLCGVIWLAVVSRRAVRESRMAST